MKRGTSATFLGSYSFVGESEVATIDAAADRTGGTPLWRALSDAGLGDQKRALIEKDRSIDFLEAHIEQRGRPESKELSIGIVTSIVSISQFKSHSRVHRTTRAQRAGGSTEMPAGRY